MLPSMLTLLMLLVAAYLIGAVPFAWLVARLHGVDIRAVGSGNVGATNVFRAVGKTAGVLTFLLDVGKGLLPTVCFPLWFASAPAGPEAGLLYGCAAIAGHNWPVYLRFKGGKGVATTAGVLLGAAPAAMGVGLGAWLLLFAIGRYVSLASIGAAIAIPLAGWWWYGATRPLLAAVLTLLGVLVVLRHRTNIKRLCNGTEHSFRKERKTD